MLVPQGMAYAFLAGMPPIYGLYGGLVPLFLYAVLGTSRHLSIGPVAVSALLVLAGVSQLAEPGSGEYITLVIFAGLLIGIAQVLMSVLKMGFFINFLSHPVIAGFTSAAAIIIAISQLKDLLGIDIPRFAHSYETLIYAIKHISEANWVSVVMCFGSIALMVGLRKINRKIPGALTVVLLATGLTYYFELHLGGLDIVGTVPEGLPAFQVPEMSVDRFNLLLTTVLSVTIIGVVESIGIAKAFEAKHQNYVVQPNQELLALGLSKIGGAFFQALPTSGSFTRSAINNNAGGQTGISSIITALIIGLTLAFFTPAFYFLPKAVLAAIILLAVQGLFEYTEAKFLWNTYRHDFYMMLATFVVTLVVSIPVGVLTGVVLSIMAVLYRSSQPHFPVLGNIPGTTSFRNTARFDETVERKGILVLRFDDQLYFGNATYFKDRIRALIHQQDGHLDLMIIDASSIHDMDGSGLHALREVHFMLDSKDIRLNLTGVIGPVRDLLVKSRLMNLIGKENLFMKTYDAIQAYKSEDAEYKDEYSNVAAQTNVEEEE